MRRTAAVAAPVLVTVALTGSLLGAPATLDRAEAQEARERTAAAFVVTAPGGAGFGPRTLERLRGIPGTEVSPTAASEVFALEDGPALIRSEARAADPGALAATTRLPLVAGKVTDLDDGSIVVNEEWERHSVGQSVRVWLGNGRRQDPAHRGGHGHRYGRQRRLRDARQRPARPRRPGGRRPDGRRRQPAR